MPKKLEAKQAEVELELKISLVGVGDKVKVDVIVEVTTCPEGVGCVGGRNDNNAKSALTKVEVKV